MVAGKVVIFLMRMLRRNATTLPGKIALRLDKQLLVTLAKDLNVTLITGTNGKTTTTGMLCSIYESAGYRVVTNVSGANLGSGVATALIEGLPIMNKKNDHIRVVIEIDEAAFGKYAKDLNPKVIAITNLFRDQLDRYGELSKTREFIRKGIEESRNAKILICADDSLCASLAYEASNTCTSTSIKTTNISNESDILNKLDASSGSETPSTINTSSESVISNISNAASALDLHTVCDEECHATKNFKNVFSKNLKGRLFFCGVEKTSMIPDSENKSVTTEAGNCVFCGATYDYSHRSFGHLGYFKCPSCGFSHPKTSLHCDYERLPNNQFNATFWWTNPVGDSMNLTLPVPGEHNVYNAMTAVGAAFLNGISFHDSKNGLLHAKAGFGRMERFKICDREVCIVLVKNPVGLERALDFLDNATDAGNLLLLLNDGIADGTDVSWIWDVDFESKRFPDTCFVSGNRCYDMALRLLYAGVAKDRITVSYDFVSMFEMALKQCKKDECLYLLPNYTSLLELRAYLSKKYHLKEIWK